MDAHALLRQPLGDGFAHQRIKGAQQTVGTHQQIHLAAQRAQHPGQFHRNVPTARHHRAARLFAQSEKAV